LTARELADEIMKQGIIESISVQRRLLEEAELKPAYRYWLTPVDENLTQNLMIFTGLYISAIERHQSGKRTISIDEMTGIQSY